MMRLIRDQDFRTYVAATPALVAGAIKADVSAALPGWYIKQMGVIQVGASVAVWALWEHEEYIL